ncbi:hypothetical protein [Streptomyces sp. NPDC002758]
MIDDIKEETGNSTWAAIARFAAGLDPMLRERVRANNPVTLYDLRVLVDEAAKAVAPDDTR